MIILAKASWCPWASIQALGISSRNVLQGILFPNLGSTEWPNKNRVERYPPVQGCIGYTICGTSFHNHQVEDIVQLPIPGRCRLDGCRCLDKGLWIVEIRCQCPPTTRALTHGRFKSPWLSSLAMLTTRYQWEDFTNLCEALQSCRLVYNSKRLTNSWRWKSQTERVRAAGYSSMNDISLRWPTQMQVSNVHW